MWSVLSTRPRAVRALASRSERVPPTSCFSTISAGAMRLKKPPGSFLFGTLHYDAGKHANDDKLKQHTLSPLSCASGVCEEHTCRLAPRVSQSFHTNAHPARDHHGGREDAV